MRTKEYNPERFLEKLAKLKEAAAEEESEFEYAIVMHTGDDSDGDPIWESKNAAANFRARVGGRYAIEKRNKVTGEATYPKETTMSDEGTRMALVKRRAADGAGGGDGGGRADRIILAVHEAMGGMASQATQDRDKWLAKYETAMTENLQLREENIKLKFALENDDDDDTLEKLLPYLDRGLALFTGSLSRKWIKEKLNGELGARVIAAIGQENAFKVFAIVADEFNKNPPAGMIAEETDEKGEAEA